MVSDVRARLHLLGEMTWLLMQSDLHRGLSLASVEALFVVPAGLGQVRVWRRGDRPVGLAVWGWLSEEAEAAHLAGERVLAAEEWRSGERLWFTDFVAPFGDLSAIVRDARRVIPPGGVARGARRGPGGEVRRVLTLHPLKP